MKLHNRILTKFKPTKKDGINFYSEIQVVRMIDMAYEQVKNKEEISDPIETGQEFYCPECGYSIYSCRC
jgi:hypothetical protein